MEADQRVGQAVQGPLAAVFGRAQVPHRLQPAVAHAIGAGASGGQLDGSELAEWIGKRGWDGCADSRLRARFTGIGSRVRC